MHRVGRFDHERLCDRQQGRDNWRRCRWHLRIPSSRRYCHVVAPIRTLSLWTWSSATRFWEVLSVPPRAAEGLVLHLVAPASQMILIQAAARVSARSPWVGAYPRRSEPSCTRYS